MIDIITRQNETYQLFDESDVPTPSDHEIAESDTKDASH